MGRSRFAQSKTEDQIRAERKARRDRRKLWKKDPDTARKTEYEEMKVQWAKNDKIIAEIKAKKSEIIAKVPKYLSYARFKCPSKYYPDAEGGKLTCKLCGKEYKWEEWGRTRSAAVTRMAAHLTDFRGHDIKELGYTPKFEIDDWAEAEDKKWEKS